MRSLTPLHLLAILATLAILTTAAPAHGERTIEKRTFGVVWSALELWWYRLTHGGHNPPGYGEPVTTSTSSIAATKTSTTLVGTKTSTFVSASTTAFSSSSVLPSSTIPVIPPTPSQTSSLTTCPLPASSYPLSCSSASTTADTCCTESPGGHLLLTEFWDTGNSSVGPADSWTLHGLWPDNCDGTYEQYCDPARELTNVTSVLQSLDPALLDYMKIYWKDYQGDDETFWEHEFNKHGTCLSTLEPKCFKNFYPQEDALAYFRKATSVYKTISTYTSLTSSGIVPSLNQTYTLAEITAAINKDFPGGVNVNCDGSTFQEVWYHYNSRGSLVDGEMIPADLVGSGSTCPKSGIHWYPKYVDIPKPAPVGSTGGNGTTPGQITDGGKIFIYAGSGTSYTAKTNFVTSTGKWFASGTPAGFTLKAITGGAYTFTSSKGPCAVDDTTKLFHCGTDVTRASEFVFGSDGTITVGGSNAFSAVSTPSGQTQVEIYGNTEKAVPIVLVGIAQ